MMYDIFEAHAQRESSDLHTDRHTIKRNPVDVVATV